MASLYLRGLAGFILCLFVMALTMPLELQAQERDVQEEDTYTVYLDGEPIVFNNPPVVDHGTILVEFRTLFEALDYQVGWDAVRNTAYGFKNHLHIEFPIDQAAAYVNGELIELPVHTRVINGRTMIPLRFLAEQSGYDVRWEEDTNAVQISSQLPEEDDKQIALASNITINGFIEVSGHVDESVRLVRLDIAHTDTPEEIDYTFLEPMDAYIDALIQLTNGHGIYTMKIYTSDNDDRYGHFKLLDTFKIVYPEDPDLIVEPDAMEPNRYIIKARLSSEAKDAILQIKKLDREAFMNISLSDIEAQELIEEAVDLYFGSGVYQVNLLEMDDGNQQVKTAIWTHKGHYGLSIDKSATEDSKVRLHGFVPPKMKWMWIQYANTTRSEMRSVYVPIVNGRVEHSLYLNMGEGVYQVKIGLTDQEHPYNSEYSSETYEIENLDQRNRYLQPSEMVESDSLTILRLAQEITDGLEKDEDRTRAIHDWVASHILLHVDSYLSDERLDNSAAEVLESRIADGQGYARLNAALHRAAGIPAKIVRGEVLIGEEWYDHYWNEIYTGGRWIIQDAAWNAGDLDGRQGIFRARLSHEYFDPDIDRFNLDHKKIRDRRE